MSVGLRAAVRDAAQHWAYDNPSTATLADDLMREGMCDAQVATTIGARHASRTDPIWCAGLTCYVLWSGQRRRDQPP